MISSRVASRLGARSTAAARAPTSTAPSGPSTSRRCCSSVFGGGGAATIGARRRAGAQRGQQPVGGRAADAVGQAALRLQRAAVGGPAAGDLDQGAVGHDPRGGLVAPPRLLLAPGGQRGQHGAVAGAEAPAALHAAPRGLRVGHEARVGPVPALVLLGHPLAAAERLGAARELVVEGSRWATSPAAYSSWARRQRPPAPVGVALALVERTPSTRSSRVPSPCPAPRPTNPAVTWTSCRFARAQSRTPSPAASGRPTGRASPPRRPGRPPARRSARAARRRSGRSGAPPRGVATWARQATGA